VQTHRRSRFKIHPALASKAIPARTELAEILFMRIRKTIMLSVLLLVTWVVTRGSAQAEKPASTDNIIARMAQAGEHNHAHFHPYVVTRNYKLFVKQALVPASEVIAELTFVPPYLKSYAIRHTHGTGVGEGVVRRMLEGQMAFAKDTGSTDISKGNYDFRFVREEDVNGYHCYVLELLPRRKAKNLLHGNIWVDTKTFLPRRVEGEPVKSSSWWLTDVHIVLLFGYIGEMWMQTSSESTADVRIAGKYKMVSQDVGYKFDQRSPVRSPSQAAILPNLTPENHIP
jgi:hypothetical protein